MTTDESSDSSQGIHRRRQMCNNWQPPWKGLDKSRAFCTSTKSSFLWKTPALLLFIDWIVSAKREKHELHSSSRQLLFSHLFLANDRGTGRLTPNLSWTCLLYAKFWGCNSYCSLVQRLNVRMVQQLSFISEPFHRFHTGVFWRLDLSLDIEEHRKSRIRVESIFSFKLETIFYNYHL